MKATFKAEVVDKFESLFRTPDGIDTVGKEIFLRMLKFDSNTFLQLAASCFAVFVPEDEGSPVCISVRIVQILQEHFATELAALK